MRCMESYSSFNSFQCHTAYSGTYVDKTETKSHQALVWIDFYCIQKRGIGLGNKNIFKVQQLPF